MYEEVPVVRLVKYCSASVSYSFFKDQYCCHFNIQQWEIPLKTKWVESHYRSQAVFKVHMLVIRSDDYSLCSPFGELALKFWFYCLSMSMSLCWSSEGGHLKPWSSPWCSKKKETKTLSAMLAAKLAEERPRQRAAVHTILTYLPQVSQPQLPVVTSSQFSPHCSAPKIFIFSSFSRPCSDHS